MKKIIASIMAVIMVLGMAAPVMAAQKKTATNKKFVTTVEKMGKVTEVFEGDTTVKIKYKSKENKGYIKFTAVDAGTYDFTVTNVQKPKRYYPVYGCLSFYSVVKDKYLTDLKVKTKGGKNGTLYVRSKRTDKKDKKYDEYEDDYSYLKKRKGSVKLEEGETIYIYCAFAGGKKKKNISFDLNITKEEE